MSEQTPAERLRDEMRDLMRSVWRENITPDDAADAAIRVCIEAALDAVDGDDGYPGECYDEAHAAVDKRIRALLPPGGERT